MTRAETETTFRFDHEERVLWACTTDQATASRWLQLGVAVRVLGRVGGEPHSWEVKLTATVPGWRQAWRQTFVRSLPGWPSFAAGGGQDPSAEGEGPENESAPQGA